MIARHLTQAASIDEVPRLLAKELQNVRGKVVFGLRTFGVQPPAVKKLYSNARSAEEKKAILRTLTAMDDESAIDLIERELGGPEDRR